MNSQKREQGRGRGGNSKKPQKPGTETKDGKPNVQKKQEGRGRGALQNDKSGDAPESSNVKGKSSDGKPNEQKKQEGRGRGAPRNDKSKDFPGTSKVKGKFSDGKPNVQKKQEGRGRGASRKDESEDVPESSNVKGKSSGGKPNQQKTQEGRERGAPRKDKSEDLPGTSKVKGKFSAFEQTRKGTQRETTQGKQRNQSPMSQGACGTSADERPTSRYSRGEHRGRGRGQPPSSNVRRNPPGNTRWQQPGKKLPKETKRSFPTPNYFKPPTQQTRHSTFRPGNEVSKTYPVLDHKFLKTSKESSCEEVVNRFSEGMSNLKYILSSQEERHTSEEFIFNLICTLAIACDAPSGQKTTNILVALKGSVFFSTKVPTLLDRVQAERTGFDGETLAKLIQGLIKIFFKYLRHLPSSYADLPREQLQRALDQLKIERKDELQKQLDAFKQERDEVIREERQRHGKRYKERRGEKPPNDFREIPVCPTNKEVVSHEIPFLRKNITKGRYEDAEHYLDVQFRLLREDFLTPLREGIYEITYNIPRDRCNQMMKRYSGARIVGKEYTRSGITYKVEFDVSKFLSTRWESSSRLIFGSFLCLSKDNFKTMLFATVANRDPNELRMGRFDIRFVERQDIVGIEKRGHEYVMVESPAYFEAYRHVLKGLKELDEESLPFKKYLVECASDVDPPEYLRREEGQEPVCYDLGKALGVPTRAAARVPVLQHETWPSVDDLHLNSSQLEALKAAITTEFSVIQGPPGTGKTYVGAKIVRCLLENRRRWDPTRTSPMLMVCYTNHALDQFLEKVLEFLSPKHVIRVGGRCQSEQLKQCNLKSFVGFFDRIQSKEVERELQKSSKKVEEWKKCFQKIGNQVLDFDDMADLMTEKHADQLYYAFYPTDAARKCKEDVPNTFKLWLCNNKQVGYCNQGVAERKESKAGERQDGPIDHQEESYKLKHFSSVDSPRESLLTQRGGLQDEFLQTMHVPLDRIQNERGLQVLQTSDKKEGRPDIELKEAEHAFPNLEISTSSTSVRFEVPSTEEQEDGESDGKANEPDQETIAVEEEAERIQSRRRVEGDEEDFLPLRILQQLEEQEKEEKHQGVTERNESEAQERQDGLIDHQEESYKLKHFSSVDSHRRVEGDAENFPALRIFKQTEEQEREETHRSQLSCSGDEAHTAEANETKLSPPHQKRESSTNTIEESKEVLPQDTDRKKDSVMAQHKTPLKKDKVYEVTNKDIQCLKAAVKKEEMMTADEVSSVDNIWLLSPNDRLRLYRYWTVCYRERFQMEIQRQEDRYEELCQKLAVVKAEEEGEVLLRATVVGMTTSCAARYRTVLQKIAPKIVVIEEAAEVMEAHIITSLTRDTKHTILIGDHKQLRPKPTVYQLAQEYNLEISLFERMVLNNMDCKRLSTQHRMRPEIAELTKRIYDHQIVDDDSVCHFDHISGISNNIFFIDHCQPEKRVKGLQSRSNLHEADFMVALCSYLLLQGYRREQITILTMYTGQLLELKERMPKTKFEGVKVCVVDNYQGEENDIILLSLVRSNTDGQIGFLKETNRICVALSRARQGLYCMGNFSLLSNQCKLWKEICNDMKTKNAISDTLRLVCKGHNNVNAVKTSSDFKRFPLGGCDKRCEHRLTCGHACTKACHATDIKHEKYRCRKACSRSCPNDHQCHKACHYPNNCEPCRRPVIKMMPECGHEQEMPCFLDPVDAYCQAPCQRLLPCNHQCFDMCGQLCEQSSCLEMINVTLECNHEQVVRCGDYPGKIKCQEKCHKSCERGHRCQKRCHFGSACEDCNVTVDYTFPTCEHSIRQPCYIDLDALKCDKPCERLRACKHPCSGICGDDCETQPCIIPVLRTLPCEHTETFPCHKNPAHYSCKENVEVKLTCGHTKWMICSSGKANSQKQSCNEKVLKELPCKHKTTLSCHTNPEGHKCMKNVDIELKCGHKRSVACSSLRTGSQEELCDMNVLKELPCKHKTTLPCYKHPEKHMCMEKVNVKLLCGHEKLIFCYRVKAGFQDESCELKVLKELPCQHKTALPCHKNPTEYSCQAKVDVKLSCGHKKSMICSTVGAASQDDSCKLKVLKELPCKHKTTLPCHINPDQHICMKKVELKLPCGHKKSTICSRISASSQEKRCERKVLKELPCKHKTTLPCYKNPEEHSCKEMVEIRLSCEHMKLVMCSIATSGLQDESCQEMIDKDLLCPGNHRVRMPCFVDPKTVSCQEECTRILNCGHPCLALCSDDCNLVKCPRKVKRRFPCGHKSTPPCFKNKTAICYVRCQRPKASCGHPCQRRCGELCSKFPCKVNVVKKLPCSHMIEVGCSDALEGVQCPASCEVKLPCGHQCSGKCSVCKQRGSHELCQHPCGRLLVCSHRCRATCSEPCPPCDKQCRRRCPHKECNKSCSEPCNPCQLPCTWNCTHYQCNKLCWEMCDWPPCNASCSKVLACGHECIGLCGENCPTLCGICKHKQLTSMLAGGFANRDESGNIVQLFNCGHVMRAKEMDGWVLEGLRTDVQFRLCPKCSNPITFSYRYEKYIKTTLRNVEDVKAQIQELVNEKVSSVKRLEREITLTSVHHNLPRLRFPSSVVSLVRGHLRVHPAPMDVRDVPYVFTLKNHLQIILQIERTRQVLLKVLKGDNGRTMEVQTHRKRYPEVTKLLLCTKDEMNKAEKCLEEPQLDLKTLSQMHDHMKKFFFILHIFEARNEAVKRQKFFSHDGETKLKRLHERFKVFLQNDDVLSLEWLGITANILRKELDYFPLPNKEPVRFDNFPGFCRGDWKLCEKGHVYPMRSIVCGGEDHGGRCQRCATIEATMRL